MLLKIQRHRLLIGGFAWLVWLLAVRPMPLEAAWARGILVLAPFIIVPLATEVLGSQFDSYASQILSKIARWQLPAAVLFAIGFLLPIGWLSMICVLPWVAVTFSIGLVGLRQMGLGAWRQGSSFALAMGMIYLPVAGIWAIMERLGFYPFNFNPEIVFLTIVHFHYAGFMLPILAGLSTKMLGGILPQINCYLTVVAVGMLAIGITTTQLSLGPDWEMLSAWLMAISATAVGWMHLRLFFKNQNPLKVRALWAISSLSLFGGMLLAGLYGSRFEWPISWLDIPTMRALHGTLNAVGFTLPAVVGWWLNSKSSQH